MSVYQIVGKVHVRATLQEVHAVDARGNPYVMLHAGVPVRLEVGALVDDVLPHELAAFPDRFAYMPDELAAHYRRQQAQAVQEDVAPVSPPPPPAPSLPHPVPGHEGTTETPAASGTGEHVRSRSGRL